MGCIGYRVPLERWCGARHALGRDRHGLVEEVTDEKPHRAAGAARAGDVSTADLEAVASVFEDEAGRGDGAGGARAKRRVRGVPLSVQFNAATSDFQVVLGGSRGRIPNEQR